MPSHPLRAYIVSKHDMRVASHPTQLALTAAQRVRAQEDRGQDATIARTRAEWSSSARPQLPLTRNTLAVVAFTPASSAAKADGPALRQHSLLHCSLAGSARKSGLRFFNLQGR